MFIGRVWEVMKTTDGNKCFFVSAWTLVMGGAASRRQAAGAVIDGYRHKQMMATKMALECMLDSSLLYYAQYVS